MAEASSETREHPSGVDKGRQTTLARLRRRRIVTVADLIAGLPRLPDRERDEAIDLVALLKIRQAVPVLIESMEEPRFRLACAHAILRLGVTRKAGNVVEFFLKVAARELSSAQPDESWLAAIVEAFAASDDLRTEEVLVEIFERRDLPGAVRGDAADKLGCASLPHDRRTRLFRRCREAAFAGLSDDSIEVQFGSMYLISSMCNRWRCRLPGLDPDFKSALPQLEQIAATDRRLSPGFWWPMSGEAEDAIECIRTGRWPDPEAAERWKRGLPVNRPSD